MWIMSQVTSSAFRYPVIYFVLYVIMFLYAHEPSWPNASIKYLSIYHIHFYAFIYDLVLFYGHQSTLNPVALKKAKIV